MKNNPTPADSIFCAALMTVQDRAYTSPIWYTPDN